MDAKLSYFAKLNLGIFYQQERAGMANAITKVITWLNGEVVGEDQFGNKYYHQRKANALRRRRWVIYKGKVDASSVPPEFNAWLHYTVNEFPEIREIKTWHKEHQVNQTGTSQAYRPSGHTFEGGQRPQATGDYKAWVPE